ncbi:TadE family protein [Nocardioides massiliensis]|uniref:Flp pilus assembly protein TadG n=1 Tax=Nocardioides massiliensis TaxID=1325935 RepID=A0ABT9NJT9_9ACTN|nr:TadE family protein [Nocardioides massiliensis]MDP9820653.1 Flp pilus assembly protein TadG [Nocardioides massiliensis]
MSGLLRRRHARSRDRGSMAVEVVLMIPVLVMFMLLVVAGGRYVTARADIEAVARDAARAASYERSDSAARIAAARAVDRGLADAADCDPPNFSGTRFEAGGVVVVRLNCRVRNQDLGLIGLGGSLPISADSAAPLETYRRTG